MRNLYNLIDKQFAYNKLKNIFYKQYPTTSWFAPATSDFLAKNLLLLKQIKATGDDKIIDLLLTKALNTFYSINQYYYFGRTHQVMLEKIYQKLLNQVRAASSKEALNTIALTHQRNLQNWLKASNPFAENIYGNTAEFINQPVTCAEYSAAHQIRLLNINVQALREPVLDVGCGQAAYLVEYLRSLGLEARGLDRCATENNYLNKTDWFDYRFKEKYWGTIISNVGFSNQFVHHHLRTDGDFVAYAKKYMEILNALQVKGTFYYAPHLPFIEQYLESTHFKILNKSIFGTDFALTKITRLR
ncbi:hypothetical protein AAE02nite_15490 [Adhaeribacter aerolatus]|uniref:Uncharacterized protein n=1 Tax=Adhaeribacter aerolatus TaxID=670289 RepID=A0A512AW01_9BACT|nr:class I SAM-dependent methyltransferase [Adhaeribacter aerolatus]GEO03885.1 hypothetical protein AAE02nite_15490 [Adhaeribacter aerolatus]